MSNLRNPIRRADKACGPIRAMPVSTQRSRSSRSRIRSSGSASPIRFSVSDHGEVIAGHGRLQAAKLIGLNLVPVVASQRCRRPTAGLRCACRQPACGAAGWDRDILAIELQGLHGPAIRRHPRSPAFRSARSTAFLDDASEKKRGRPGPGKQRPRRERCAPVLAAGRPVDSRTASAAVRRCPRLTTTTARAARWRDAPICSDRSAVQRPRSMARLRPRQGPHESSRWRPAKCRKPSSPRSCRHSSAARRPHQRWRDPVRVHGLAASVRTDGRRAARTAWPPRT